MPGIELSEVLVRIHHQEFRAKGSALDLTGTKVGALRSVKGCDIFPTIYWQEGKKVFIVSIVAFEISF